PTERALARRESVMGPRQASLFVFSSFLVIVLAACGEQGSSDNAGGSSSSGGAAATNGSGGGGVDAGGTCLDGIDAGIDAGGGLACSRAGGARFVTDVVSLCLGQSPASTFKALPGPAAGPPKGAGCCSG